MMNLMSKRDLKKCKDLGILEEVKSIVANCECGETEKVYIEDLSKMRKWEIQEMIGNFLDANLYGREFCSEGRRMKTFCKAYGIEESEIAEYYAKGISEWGYSIAYRVTDDIVVVLE